MGAMDTLVKTKMISQIAGHGLRNYLQKRDSKQSYGCIIQVARGYFTIESNSLVIPLSQQEVLKRSEEDKQDTSVVIDSQATKDFRLTQRIVKIRKNYISMIMG